MNSKPVPIDVTVDGTTHHLFKRRLKYRERTRLAGILRDGITPQPKLNADGEPVRGDDGDPLMIVLIPIERIGKYRLELIHVSLCNEAGQAFFTRDEIDEWDTPDIDRIVDQIEKENRLGDDVVEEVRGNSEATPVEGSSSTSA